MKVPLEIAFNNVERSSAVEAIVRERVAKLPKFFRNIISCRVVIEAPHRSPNEDVLQYRVRIDMSVPGVDLVVSRDPTADGSQHDLYVVIRDAFNAAERQLKTYSGKLREQRKPRELPPQAVVLRVFPEEGYGFLMTPDGEQVYFHRNSVLDGQFDQLEPGDEVRYSEEQGTEGPQASTVQAIGRHGRHTFTSPDAAGPQP